MTKVLVLEDDAQIAKSLSMGLTYGGFEVTCAGTVAQAWMEISQNRYDVVLLDVGLPDGSGIELCQRVRSVGKTVPILFLSAKTDEDSVVRGITAGGDDYIRKPFGIEELKARMNKLLRRTSQPGKILTAGPLVVDLEKRLATVKGRTLNLGRREFDILALLAKKAGDIVTRDSIIASLDEEAEVYDRTIDSHISHMRRKMRDVSGNVLQILSIYGVGYRLDWEK